jgi:hypothetical protein
MCMNPRMLPSFVAFFYTTFCSFCALSCYAQEFDPERKASEDLSKKVVRVPLNQNLPADVKVGLQGITTLEFPGKIEAIMANKALIDQYWSAQRQDCPWKTRLSRLQLWQD